MATSSYPLARWLAVSLIASVSLQTQAVVADGSNAHRQRRRRLAPHESIHRHLRRENEAGNMRPRLTLAAMKTDEDEASEDVYAIDVIQANQAVTDSTTYSIDTDGPSYLVGDLHMKFLVQDRTPLAATDEGEDTAFTVDEKKQTALAIIAIDDDTETVNGIFKLQDDAAMNIHQLAGSNVIASKANDFVPPKNFECQVNNHDFVDRQNEGKKRSRVRNKGKKTRELAGEHVNEHDHGHHHDHNDHDHFDMDFDNLISAIPPHQRPKQRRAAGFPANPSHQVDIFIEIDQQFVDDNGGGNITDAFRYVNTIVTAASTIYESEVDTRLTVAHIAITNHYENFTSSRDALDRMRDIYGSETEWHYTDGNGVDAHHAILGRRMNGGVAYVGTVCNPDLAFAISPNMRGSFITLDFATVWDVSVFAHETGHLFGSLHTFDRNVDAGGYKPPVDRCFIREGDDSTCPSDAELQGSATIMSYCDSCPGADSRTIAYTFGGQFAGGDPHDLNSWRNSPGLVGRMNKEPRRVPKAMYDHISSQDCVEPNFQCQSDSDCIDWRRCTISQCDVVSGTCEHSFVEDCCGNNICESDELPCGVGGICMKNERTCHSDCGPFKLETKRCRKCKAKRGRGNGVMFTVEPTLSAASVLIHNIGFRHTNTQSSTVTIYTVEGSYVDKATTPDVWVVANETTIEIGGQKGGYASMNFESGIAIAPGTARSFYIVSTGKLISGNHEEGVDSLATDDSLNIKYPARIVGATRFGGGMDGEWDGNINYSIYPMPSLFG